MRSPNENNRMKQGQQNNRRGRHNNNRRNNNNNNNNNNNGKPQNMLTKNFDSNGPSVKIRGNANTIAEKYTTLAHDAISAGSRIKAENYFQHAEHYKRIVQVATEQQAEQKAAHEAKQTAQRAAHAEQQAARAEQQAARAEELSARAEQQVEQNTQPDLELPAAETISENAPSMTNNNNMPVDILSNNEPSDAVIAEAENKPKPKRTRQKRKPMLNRDVASTTPVDVEAKQEARADAEQDSV